VLKGSAASEEFEPKLSKQGGSGGGGGGGGGGGDGSNGSERFFRMKQIDFGRRTDLHLSLALSLGSSRSSAYF
jgi:hypothetical protein